MNQFLPKTTKGEIFKGMMRNPKTAQLIKDAFASGVGSTSRAKAKKAFSIMDKLQYSHDGSGGPGAISNQLIYDQQIPNPTMDYNQPPVVDGKSMVIFHKIPTPKINYGGKKITQKQDGSGGPGAPVWHDGAGGFWGDLGDRLKDFAEPFTTQIASVFQSSPEPEPKPESTWERGLIQKGASWLGKTAVPAAAKTWLATYMAPAAIPEYLLRNIKAGTTSLGRTLFGYDRTKPYEGAGYTNLGSTQAGKMISNLWPNLRGAINTPPKDEVFQEDLTTDQVSEDLGLRGESPAPLSEDVPRVGVAPSFYSSLGGALASTGSFGTAAGSLIDRLIATESGGDYSAIGRLLLSGENQGYRALGKYQIMPNLHFANIGLDADSEEDVEKFLNTPELQDTLFSNILIGLYEKYNGDETKVAAAYFAGPAGAQAYGTPAGDDLGDGNMSVNQYVASLTGPGLVAGSYSGIQAAIDSGKSSAMTYTNRQMGETLAEIQVRNQERIWDKYNIDSNRETIERLKDEVISLPEDMEAYITSRDLYIKKTDKAIKDYLEEMKGKDMSDPADSREAQQHLNYLYTLRGRQNQSYMGYINNAVEDHEAKLNDAIDRYNLQLERAERELTGINAISKENYTMEYNALIELYESVKGLPDDIARSQILQNNAYGAAELGASDAAKLDRETGYLGAQRDILIGSVIDKDLRALPGINLVWEIAKAMEGDPSMRQGSMIRAYEEGIQKWFTTVSEADNTTGTGVTDDGKMQIAKEAIRNFAELANTGVQSGNDVAIIQGWESASFISDLVAGHIARLIIKEDGGGDDSISGIMEAVETLADTGWFGRKESPSLEEFIETVKDNINNDTLADSIARAIYAVFERYVQDSSAKSAVEALMNDIRSMTDRKAYTTNTFANGIGRIYGGYILEGAFNSFGITVDEIMAIMDQSS